MSAPGPENQGASQEINQLRAEVAQQTAQSVVNEVMRMAVKAAEVKRVVDVSIGTSNKAPDQFEGNDRDKTSLKGKAVDLRRTVQKVLLTAQGSQPKELIPQGATPDTQGANRILKRIGAAINPEDVTEISAPYLYSLVNKILSGEITSVDTLATEFANIRYLAAASPEMYKRVQKALVDYAHQDGGISEPEAKKKFFLTEDERVEKEYKENIQRKKEQLSPDEEKRFGDLIHRVRSSMSTVAKGDEFFRHIAYVGDYTDKQIQDMLEPLHLEPGEIGDLIRLSRQLRDSRDYEDPNNPRDRKYENLRRFGYMNPDLLRTFNVDSLKYYLEDDGTGKGTKRLSNLGKRTLKKQALFTLNQMMSKVDSNPETDFHTNFSDLREGMAYFDLQTMVEDLAKGVANDQGLQATLGQENLRDLTYFINKGVTQELAREKSLRELFHTMGIYIKTLGPDKIAEFVARYNLSDIDTIVTSDFSGKLVSLAMSEYERYLKYDITKNKGQLRTSLFAGISHLDLMYKDNDDRTNLIERIKSTLDGLKVYAGQGGILSDAAKKQISDNSEIQRFDIENIEGYESWEIERALKYAQGIQLTQTIRGFEVIASSRPPGHFRGSADNMVDMAGILNPHWKWQLGRGGLRKMPRYREAMVADMITKRPEKNLIKRIFGDKWDPAEMHKKYKDWNEDQWHGSWEEIKDKWLYKDTNFQNMIKLLGLGGLASRHGWRLEGFKNGVDARGSEFFNYISSIQTAVEDAVSQQPDGKKFQFGANWIKTYDKLAYSVGVGSRFFFDVNRAQDVTKTELWKQLGLNPSHLSSQEKNELWDEYTYGKYGNKEVFTLGGQKMTAMEYAEAKSYVFRGMNFQALLERSPLDFLNNLINVTPELMPKSMGGDKDDFYFIFDRPRLEAELHKQFPASGAYEDNLKKAIAVQNNLRRMWGDGNDRHLDYIRKFYGKIYEWGLKQDGCKKPDGSGDREQIFEKLYRQMDLAIEKVRLRNAPTMSDSDITDPELQKLFFGTDGLVTHFKDLHEDFGVEGDNDARFGQKGFFYHMGRSWFNELGNQFVPDTTDVDWRFILHNMGANSGENMVKRLWGDLNAYNGVMSKLMGLDDLLSKCAHSHSLEELMKLHNDIRGLKGIAGDEAVYEMQYYLAQVAARYFQEHHNARMPFLLGGVWSLFNGKEMSLSKIYGGKGAMTLTTDGINAYFQSLQHNDLIAEEGIYGFQRLAQSLGADWQKLVVSELIPNVSTALALYLLWKYISEAMSESEGKKKK